MNQLQPRVFRRLARATAWSVLLLAACQAPPAGLPDDGSEDPLLPEAARPALVVVRPPREGPQRPVDEGPGRVRPAWNGTRKQPASASPLAYPTTWQGDPTVTDLAMVGASLYTLDRTLQAVPLSGGKWEAVPLAGVQDLTRLASDGVRLFAGTRQGQVVGLDPANRKVAPLATVPSAVTALEVGSGALWVGTEGDGVFRIPLGGGTPQALGSGDPAARSVSDLALGTSVVFTLGDRVWAWPMDGATPRGVPGTEGATALTTHRGVLYAGMADGWLMRSRDQGATSQALGQVIDTPLEAVGTDGEWLYASSGNTAYMLDLRRYGYSLCHAGFRASVTSLTVLDGATVLVGTRAKGLTSMPR